MGGGLLALVKQMSQEQKYELAKALGLGTPTRRTGRKGMANEQARRLVLQQGEVVRDNLDFLPAPPESVTLMGPKMVELWLEKWREGTLAQTAEMEMIRDGQNMEEMAQNSHM